MVWGAGKFVVKTARVYRVNGVYLSLYVGMQVLVFNFPDVGMILFFPIRES